MIMQLRQWAIVHKKLFAHPAKPDKRMRASLSQSRRRVSVQCLVKLTTTTCSLASSSCDCTAGHCYPPSASWRVSAKLCCFCDGVAEYFPLFTRRVEELYRSVRFLTCLHAYACSFVDRHVQDSVWLSRAAAEAIITDKNLNENTLIYRLIEGRPNLDDEGQCAALVASHRRASGCCV